MVIKRNRVNLPSGDTGSKNSKNRLGFISLTTLYTLIYIMSAYHVMLYEVRNINNISIKQEKQIPIHSLNICRNCKKQELPYVPKNCMRMCVCLCVIQDATQNV